MSTSLLAFLAVSAVVIATPGPDTALTIRNTLAGGRRAGVATALGVSAGQVVWAIATSLGLVAVLLASEPIFHALKFLGAGYLVYLGVQSLRSALRGRDRTTVTEATTSAGRLGTRKAFCQGIVNDLANPKMAVFFASVLPQFAPQGQGMLSHLVILGVVFASLTFLWLSLYACALAAAGTWFQRSGMRRLMEGLAGAALLGMGVKVATSER